jgi:integrase
MPKLKMTAAAVERVKASKGERIDYFDDHDRDRVRGLVLRVSGPTDTNLAGSRSWAVLYRVKGSAKLRRLTIGDFPTYSLADARGEAEEIIRSARRGKDPADARKAAAQKPDSVAAVAEDYIKRRLLKLRSGDHAEGVIRRELLGQSLKRTKDAHGKAGKVWVNGKNGRWRDRPISEIGRRDVVELVEAIVDRGNSHLARLTFAHTRSFFAWAIERSTYGLEHSPCELVRVSKLIGRLKPRDRVLNDGDIRQVWAGAGKVAYPFGPFTKMLLLTGQRRNEVAHMRWPETDLKAKLWTIPAERMKGAHPHLVPLSEAAIDLLNSLPRFKGDYVFTTTAGQRPISGFGKGKERVDEKAAEEGAALAGWRLHDLRRTVRTRLSELKVPDLVAELVIAHQKPGLHKVYDQHAYLDEKRDALDAWARRLHLILQSPQDNVVSLRAPA